MKRQYAEYIVVAVGLLMYAAFAYMLNFYQDDAYISYRYVQNFLNGDGLVFNIGERIEGYTNFGWVIWLILWGALGANFLLVSKITGFVLGAGIIVVAYLTAKLVFDQRSGWFAAGAALLVGVNYSLAYWSPAGLETAAFAFCAVLALYLYLKRSWALIPTLMFAVLLRPEGAMVTGLLIIIEAIQVRGLPKFTLLSAAVAFLFSLPFVGFKLAYYGDILPNPFYAKTSFDMSQLANGWEYVWRFLRHYGFVGVGLIVPLLFWKKLSREAQAVWLYAVIYTLYILFIGGDVLKVHRFFLPLFGAYAILAMLTIHLVLQGRPRGLKYGVLGVVLTGLIILTVTVPREFVFNYNFQEKAFTRKMDFRARYLLESDSSDFSVALPTIGIFGYKLIGHEIIDMVGLTDSTIARHSEDPIPGMESTWKEAAHNTAYLLRKGPDYIMFSTGIKPSAPAEKALFLYKSFQDAYRTRAWHYRHPDDPGTGVMVTAFKKVHPIEEPIEPTYPVEFVEQYKRGLDAYSRQDHRTAVQHYTRALAASPDPPYIYLLYQKAYSHMMLSETNETLELWDEVLKRDSALYEVHRDLFWYALGGRNMEKARYHRDWLKKLVPWYVPRLDSLATASLRKARR